MFSELETQLIIWFSLVALLVMFGSCMISILNDTNIARNRMYAMKIFRSTLLDFSKEGREWYSLLYTYQQNYRINWCVNELNEKQTELSNKFQVLLANLLSNKDQANSSNKETSKYPAPYPTDYFSRPEEREKPVKAELPVKSEN